MCIFPLIVWKPFILISLMNWKNFVWKGVRKRGFTFLKISIVFGFLVFLFLAHLSWKFKWAFLIACCPSYNVYLYDFSHSRTTYFNQPWHKASLGEWDLSLLKRRVTLFFQGEIIAKQRKYILMTFKTLLL